MKPQQITLFSASAGSGKTYTLTIEYLKMALSEVETKGYFRRILAVTFTIKAAEEMRQRILQFLSGIADYPSFHSTSVEDQPKFVSILTKIQQELAGDGIDLSKEELASRAATTLQQILQDYGLFSVMTIDSFVQRLSASFIDELNLPNQYEILLDSNNLIHELINRLLDQVNNAGDGELSDLILSFANQEISEGRNWNRMRDSLHSFLKITLDEKFLKIEPQIASSTVRDFLHLEDQLRTLNNQMLEEVKQIAANFCSIIGQMNLDDSLYFYGSKGPVGIMKSAVLSPELADKSYSYLKTAIEKNTWSSGKASSSDKALIESNSAELSDLGSQFLELQSIYSKRYRFLNWVLKDLKKIALLNLIQREMRLYQQENSAIPISEFSKRVYEVISTDPIPFIYEKLGDRYFHIFIDEFQDTSILQWKNFMPLIENATSIGKRSLLVGDAKQSIYKFRGGEVSLIASLSTQNASLVSNHFEEDSLDESRFSYLLNQVSPASLADNYRSAKEIVNFNNDFFGSLTSNEQVNALCPLIAPLYGNNLKQNPKIPSAELNGTVDLLVYHKSKEPTGYTEPENEFMLNQVIQLIQHNRKLGFDYQDIAILTRKNKHSRFLALRLKEIGIPIISSDSLLVHYSPLVGFILSYLSLLENPKENLFFYELVYQFAEIRGKVISEAELEKLSSYSSSSALTNSIVYFKDQGIVVPVFIDLLQWVYELISAFDLLTNEEGQDYLWKFLDILNEYVLNKDKLTAGFLAHFNQNRNNYCITSNSEADAVTISSIHKSKGLEYPVVIVPYINWTFQAESERIWFDINLDETSTVLGDGTVNLPPIYGRVNSSEIVPFPSLSNAAQVEKDAIFLDALNMLYVATTRPKQSLHLLLTVPEADMHSRTIASFDQSVGKLLYQYAEDKGTRIDLPEYLQIDSSLACSYYTFSDSIVVPNLSREEVAKQAKNVQLQVKIADQAISLRVNSAKVDLYTASSTKREIGNRLHDLLAQLPDFDAWQDVKSKSKVDVSLIDELFKDSKVQGFFKKENLAFKEVDLLCPDGLIVRPDRVNRVGDALQVIDFKTGKYKPEHDEQIARYKQTLQSMGHQVTKGVLIYLETKELRYV